ncbi:hypothetical protein PoB_005264300 [Plakobranchus ocellatus]|uniref:Uncharacterized protein n=1 Tax=Plakobranchus ocellatus TaxID=259542 RepID=A0AAV4C2K3_9GAST|nr:hypothetical protein PoB_005264300 [Plakobranchus ocellatus]
MRIFSALLIALFSQAHSKRFQNGRSSRVSHFDLLDVARRLGRDGHAAEHYDLIGNDLPVYKKNVGDVVNLEKTRLTPEENLRENKLQGMLDFLTKARSNILSHRHVNGDMGRARQLDIIDGVLAGERRRRHPNGGKRRGGRGKGGRRRGRHNRRRRAGKNHRGSPMTNGEGMREFRRDLSRNLRFKRSSQSGQYSFDEHGVFGGLQQLPFDQEQSVQIVSIDDMFAVGKSSSSNTFIDLIPLPTDNVNKTVLSSGNLGEVGNSINSRNETNFDVKASNFTEVQATEHSKGGRSRRRGNNRGRHLGRRRGGKDKHDNVEPIIIPSQINSTSQDLREENLPNETPKIKSRRLGRGKNKGEETQNGNNESRRRGGRDGRKKGGSSQVEGGRRRGGRRGDKASLNQDASSAAPSDISLDTLNVDVELTDAANSSDPSRRQKRAVGKDGGFQNNMLGTFTIPKGKLFKWNRYLGGINSVNEFAFASTERNVAVVMSFDPKLSELGFTNGATLYDFTGHQGIVALRPRVPSSPCYLIETSQTFEEIVAELGERNSTSVATNTVIALDGSGNPVSKQEYQALLEQTPSLRRQCRGRSIVRATPYGISPLAHTGATQDLKVLTLDNEVTLTVRQQPPDPVKVGERSFPAFRISRIRPWSRLRSMLGRGSGRLAQWIGQGRWGMDQDNTNSPEAVQIGNETVTPVPSPNQGFWGTSASK